MVMVFVVNSLYQKREVIAHFFANSLKLRLLIRKSDSRLDTTLRKKEVIKMTFFTTAVTGLKTVVTAIGAGVAVWGVINLLEGYGNDNPGANAHVR